MPKSKPTQVIVHRIELQESERRILEQVASGYTFRNVSKGIFNITSDMTTVVILAIFLEWVWPGRFAGVVKLITDALSDSTVGGIVAMAIGGAWEDFKQAREAAGESYTQYSEDIEDFWSALFGEVGDAGAGFRAWLRGNS